MMPFAAWTRGVCGRAALAVVLSLVLARSAWPTPEPDFPEQLSPLVAGAGSPLLLTGVSERIFFIFRVYRIAHYVEASAFPGLSLESVLDETVAKALVIRFDRSLTLKRIRDEFSKSIRRNAPPGWLDEAGTSIAAFLAAIDRDVHQGDRFALFWMPGGQLVAEFNDEPAFEVTDVVFARLLWSIWFGDDPACDREALLANLPAGEPA